MDGDAGTEAGLSPVQRKAINLLTQGKSLSETAEILDRDPKTMSRWMRQSEFKAELNRRLDEADRAEDLLMLGLRKDASERLRQLMQSDDEKIALRACVQVLGSRSRIDRRSDFERRVGETYRSMGGTPYSGGGGA
jgi:DNA-binding CsgD family transcriptional regulator